MKGIYFDGSKAVYREDLPVPVPAPGESLVRVLLSAVCNTDKEIRKGYRPDFRGVMGHEFVGVAEKSDRAEFIGKRVVGELNASCGKCVYCQSGRQTHCKDRRVIGMHGKDGCFAEFMTIDSSLLHAVPDSLPSEKAIFTEPLAAAFEILTQVNITKGLKTAILGDGRLALCAANALAGTGADLTVVGKHDEKLALFQTLARTVKQGEPEGYEVVVEATGSPSGLETALSLVRHKGTIVLKSTYAEKPTIDMSCVAVNEITIVGSRCGPFPPAVALLAGGKAQFPPIELYGPEEFEEAFSSKAFKAGFRFTD